MGITVSFGKFGIISENLEVKLYLNRICKQLDVAVLMDFDSYSTPRSLIQALQENKQAVNQDKFVFFIIDTSGSEGGSLISDGPEGLFQDIPKIFLEKKNRAKPNIVKFENYVIINTTRPSKKILNRAIDYLLKNVKEARPTSEEKTMNTGSPVFETFIEPNYDLNLYFPLSEFSESEVADMISLLSELYVSVGGDELVISGLDIFELKGEPEPEPTLV